MAILCGLFCGSIALNIALGILLYIKVTEDINDSTQFYNK